MLTRQEYLLNCLQEEAIEIAHAASKCIRFTPLDGHHSKTSTNIEDLEREIRDFMTVLNMLEDELKLEIDISICKDKIARVEHFMDYSRNLGVLMP